MKRYECCKPYDLHDLQREIEQFTHEMHPCKVYMFTRQVIEHWYLKECMDDAMKAKMIEYIAPLYRPLSPC